MRRHILLMYFGQNNRRIDIQHEIWKLYTHMQSCFSDQDSYESDCSTMNASYRPILSSGKPWGLSDCKISTFAVHMIILIQFNLIKMHCSLVQFSILHSQIILLHVYTVSIVNILILIWFHLLHGLFLWSPKMAL